MVCANFQICGGMGNLNGEGGTHRKTKNCPLSENKDSESSSDSSTGHQATNIPTALPYYLEDTSRLEEEAFPSNMQRTKKITVNYYKLIFFKII
jgi:hypothetical protein